MIPLNAMNEKEKVSPIKTLERFVYDWVAFLYCQFCIC